MQHKLDDHKRAFEITEKGDGKANTAQQWNKFQKITHLKEGTSEDKIDKISNYMKQKKKLKAFIQLTWSPLVQ